MHLLSKKKLKTVSNEKLLRGVSQKKLFFKRREKIWFKKLN